MANMNAEPTTKEVKEKIFKLIKDGELAYISTFSIKYGLKYEKEKYAILFDPNIEIGGRLATKKYIFKVKDLSNIGSYKGEPNEIVTLENIINQKTKAGSFTKHFSKKLLIQFADLVKLLSANELKALVARDHIIKYAQLLKEQFNPDEVKEAQEKINTDQHKTVNKEKVKTMKNDKLENMLNTNTESAKTASAIAAGATINKVVMEKLRPQLPMIVRGYADSPLADVIVANLVVFAAQNFAAQNDKAQWVAEAMLTAAMTNFMSSFNLEGLMQEVLASANVEVPTEH